MGDLVPFYLLLFTFVGGSLQLNVHDFCSRSPFCHDEIYGDPDDCNCYYQCSYLILHHQCCAEELIFDVNAGVCDWPFNMEKQCQAQCTHVTGQPGEAWQYVTAETVPWSLSTDDYTTDEASTADYTTVEPSTPRWTSEMAEDTTTIERKLTTVATSEADIRTSEVKTTLPEIVATTESMKDSTTAAEVEPTLPDIGDLPPVPHYKVILLGSFTSADGSDYTAECVSGYSTNLQQKATSLIPELNSMIGSELCSGFHDAEIASVSTAFTASGSMGATEVSYALSASPLATIHEVYICADELNAYLQDFDNWGYPVIPPVPGCPVPDFDPNHFIDGTTGSDWLCLTLMAGLIKLTTNMTVREPPVTSNIERKPPQYHLNLFDNFTTISGEDLTVDCTRDYANDWQEETTEMASTLSQMISNGELCPRVQDTFTVQRASSGFTSFENKGTLTVTFFMAPTDDNIQFIEVYACVAAIFDHVEDHQKWGLPLLPPPYGCPGLTFDALVFTYNGEGWIC